MQTIEIVRGTEVRETPGKVFLIAVLGLDRSLG